MSQVEPFEEPCRIVSIEEVLPGCKREDGTNHIADMRDSVNGVAVVERRGDEILHRFGLDLVEAEVSQVRPS